MDVAGNTVQAAAGTVHSRGDRFLVIDDLLPDAEFEAVAEVFARTELVPRVNNTYSAVDGPSYRGETVRRPLLDPGAEATDWEQAIASRIREHFALYRDQVFTPQAFLVSTPWGYPGGSQLHWHKDSGAEKLGAFIFYVHRHWNAFWGGALAVLDTESFSEKVTDEEIMNGAENPVIITPKPNRLVLLRASTPHSIQRVEAGAGESLRSSFAGFVFENA